MFTMLTVMGLSLTVLVVPTYVTIEVLDMGLKAAWSLGVAYIISLGIAFLLRYQTGKWRAMRVIDQAAKEPAPSH